jgi:hypothetical protein
MFVAAAVESRDAQEKGKKPQFLTKVDGFLSFTPCYMEKYFFFSFYFFNLTPFMTKLRVLVLCFPFLYIMDNSIVLLPTLFANMVCPWGQGKFT